MFTGPYGADTDFLACMKRNLRVVECGVAIFIIRVKNIFLMRK